MGMYDSVVLSCPMCGFHVKVQSKAGECQLNDFEQNAVPTCDCNQMTKELCGYHAQIVRDEVKYALKIERDARKMEGEKPIPLRLRCPVCHTLHIDEGEIATRPHKTHTCQSCGEHFQPALVPTVGVKFLPGCGPTKQS